MLGARQKGVGMTLFEFLLQKRVVIGGGDIRRLLDQRAIRINGKVITMQHKELYPGDVVNVGKNVELTYGEE